MFDQLDIVAALQTGNYLQGPYAVGQSDDSTIAKQSLESAANSAIVEHIFKFL